MAGLAPAYYVTFMMWPIYVAWVALSKRLTGREKGLWLFIVLVLNMAGMPMFYVFMVRRYLGLEGRTGRRDEAWLDRFLTRHGVAREALSPAQLGVLRAYCRDRRLTLWCAAPMCLIAGLMLYMAIVPMPRLYARLFSDFTPTRTVIVDSATHARKEVGPDAEAQRAWAQATMLSGALIGMVGTMGLTYLAMALSLPLGDRGGRALVAFLKATAKPPPPGPPA